jgi:hypothetical protein
MFKLYYNWRYKRSQRAGAFKLPKSGGTRPTSQIGLGSYLSQSSVRGRNSSRFDLPKKSRLWLGLLCITLATLALGWLIYESIEALFFFHD